MSSSIAVRRFRELLDRSRTIAGRVQAQLAASGADGVPPAAAASFRIALEKLDRLLCEEGEAIVAQLAAERGPGPGNPRAETILEVARALGHVLEEAALAELIMDLVIQHSKAERGFLVLGDGPERFQIRAARNLDYETIADAEREISRSIIRSVWNSGQPLVRRNALDDAALGATGSVVALRILSVLSAPLLVDGKVCGVIYLESRSVQGLFDEEDLAFLGAFCEQAGVALRNARAVADARRAERQLSEENVRLRAEVAERHAYRGIIGGSRRMREVYELVERVAAKPVTVLVRGENGTGKELIARVIHYNSPRRQNPFVSVNCAALPETLIESELFGIEKGTATSVEGRRGKFEVADGGTLFLDEIGDMSLVTQAKLLRVLQEREIERVGGRKPIPVDVRIVAATNVDLERAIVEKRFREDLYYRLNVVPIVIPPLRERAEDIPLLAMHFLAKIGTQYEMPGRRLTPEALDSLCRYAWPGNVRELENVLSRAIVLGHGEEIGPELLPAPLRALAVGSSHRLPPGAGTLEDLEESALVRALEKNAWVQTRAAAELGISERNLRYKMKKFGLRRPPRGADARGA